MKIIENDKLHTLRPGDIVRVTSPRWAGAFMQGPLVERDGALYVGMIGWTTSSGYLVRRSDGAPTKWGREVVLVTPARRAPNSVTI